MKITHKKSRRSKLAARIPKPRISQAVKSRLNRGKSTEDGYGEAMSNLPRITNETVAEHREEVLSSARKYIYPLQHSRGRIIKISTSLFIAAILVFFAYLGLALYKFQSTSTFVYQVTRVIPLPVAKAGPHIVSYESYLFELRHLMHYYQTQQKEDFNDPKTAGHLVQLRKDSLEKVINDAYVKQLADKNNITVSNREVDAQIALVKSQNRLGTSDQMLADVLRQFWDWSVTDFRRELKSQLLAQKVASQLDSASQAKARNALMMIQEGKDFAEVAAQMSEDESTKANGGKYAIEISQSNRDVPPQVVDALSRLQIGQVSEVVNTGYTLEIVKLLEVGADNKYQAAHVSFRIEGVERHIKPLREESPPVRLIKV